MSRLLNVWDRFRTGFWFIPGLMALVAVALAFVMPAVDAALPVAERAPWLATTPASAGRTLSAFGAAIATMAGVVFSTTMVVLSLTSQQFGPRLLRSFLTDRTTQLTLGAFVGTSLYTLLVMRVIREVEGNPIAPDLSVQIAVLISVLTICQLVFFIHHLSVRIQATEVLRAVAADLDEAINRLFPEPIQAEPSDPEPPPPADRSPNRRVASTADGYLQGFDIDRLMRLAVEHDLVVRLPRRVGDFVACGDALALITPANRFADDLTDDFRGFFHIGSRSTPRQDVESVVGELVEVAVRALSPGTNDPFTAMSSLDYLGAALGRLAQRRMPPSARYDDRGRLRIISKPPTFESVLNTAFHLIRQYGRDHVGVTIRGLESLTAIARRATNDRQREAIRRQAEMYLRGSDILPEKNDREAVRQRYDRLVELLTETRSDSNGDQFQ